VLIRGEIYFLCKAMAGNKHPPSPKKINEPQICADPQFSGNTGAAIGEAEGPPGFSGSKPKKEEESDTFHLLLRYI
jgi:hypothetical protein